MNKRGEEAAEALWDQLDEFFSEEVDDEDLRSIMTVVIKPKEVRIDFVEKDDEGVNRFKTLRKELESGKFTKPGFISKDARPDSEGDEDGE